MIVNVEQAKKIIERHGANHQRYKAAEELSELMTLILQDANQNGKVPISRITEEIADVYVMLRQLELIYLLDDRDVQPIIDYKLQRTAERDENERWEKAVQAEKNLHRR